jgi:Immunoglobulin domain
MQAGHQQLQPRPESERRCNLGDCPSDANTTSGPGHRSSVIATDPIIFTQLLPTMRLSLDVGSTATLIPGSTVNIHCPVGRGFSRNKITWLRPGEVPVTKNGRVKVSGAGSMRIRKSRPADAGSYTCVAGQDMASADIAFHSEDEAASMAEQRLMMAAEGNNRVCIYVPGLQTKMLRSVVGGTKLPCSPLHHGCFTMSIIHFMLSDLLLQFRQIVHLFNQHLREHLLLQNM